MKAGNKTDVLIIGAGASAAAFAYRLSRDGFKIICLEQGPWQKRIDYPQHRADWETHFRGSMNMNPNLRGLSQDYPVNVDDSDVTPLMYNSVGGSTIVWGAHFPRLHPSDFRVYSDDGVASDWPLSYSELVPFFDENDRMMGVSGLAGDPFYPPKPERPMPPLALGIFGETLARGFNKLGWHWWPADAAICSVNYKDPAGNGRSACNYGGSCVLGCRRGARSSPDLNYWPAAVKAGVRLKTGSRVKRILINTSGRARGVVYVNPEGDNEIIEADLVVLAANGVGTPRLLLASANNLYPNGLANSSDQVGRNMMVHPPAFVTGVFPSDIESYKGPVGNILYSHEFYETDISRGFVRGFQLQAQRQYGGLDTALGGVVGAPVPWGSNHHAEFRRRMGRLATLLVLADDLPEEGNRIVLDHNLSDPDGIPAPKLIYSFGENTKKILDFGVERATELMKAAGATEVLVNPRVREVFHLMGTARMGNDPETSVVDKWGRSHDIANLFIIDGSVFVTGGSANPTSTVQALALRFADFISRNRREVLR